MIKIAFQISHLFFVILFVSPSLAAQAEQRSNINPEQESVVESEVEAQIELKSEPGSKPDPQINEAAILLTEILKNTITYRAQFKQSVYRENSDIADVTLGTFLIQRPNHFRWQTTKPFEQTIVADGESLWTYDPELEQATLQNQHAVLADSPLLLLTSSVGSLIEAFDISEIATREEKGADKKPVKDKHLFSLLPRKNSLFETVHILIKDKKIEEFFLTDTLGGRTSVEFSNIELNQKIDIYDFIFVPPKDIDIIDSREFITD